MSDYEPDEYDAANERLAEGDVYTSTSETLLITSVCIDAENATGTVTYVPVSDPTEEQATTMDAVEFDSMVSHTGDYVAVDQSVLQRASDVLIEYIEHNLSIDANRLGVSHPHSAASTVGDVIAANRLTSCSHEWPPAILADDGD